MERKKRNHNEGSIRERADGRFEIRVTAGYDFEIGKPKRISYYAKTNAPAIINRHGQKSPSLIALSNKKKRRQKPANGDNFWCIRAEIRHPPSKKQS